MNLSRWLHCLFLLIFFLSFLPGLVAAYDGTELETPSLSETVIGAGTKLKWSLGDDAGYLLGSVVEDAGDLIKLPFETEYKAKGFVFGTLLLGSIPATIYGLDRPIRREMRRMPDGTAGILEDVGLAGTATGLGLLYGWGLYTGNEEARHAVLTGAEGIGLASLLGLGAKAAFSRPRPKEGEGPKAFFKGGESFPSGRGTVVFAAATTLSEAFDNRWWAALPAYSLPVMAGVGRMGKDEHWASDVLASAILGVGTTKLLFYLHRQREWPSSSLTVMPRVSDGRVSGASLGFAW